MSRRLGMRLGFAAALVVLWLFVRYFLLVMPLKVALKEFTYFDWLAFDDYRPAPLRGWSLFFEYGERT